MDLRISELEDFVSKLSEEVRYLRGEVARLRREAGGSVQPRGAYQVDLDSRSAAASAGRRFVSGSEASYSLVGDVSESAPASPAPTRSSCSSVTTEGGLTWLEREEICRGIGAFVKKSLSGSFHGTSGRDRINLPSRIWIVFRDYQGAVYSPPKVFRQFTFCKPLVKRGGSDLGESVFVGLPSEREAQVVVASAGFAWPINHQ